MNEEERKAWEDSMDKECWEKSLVVSAKMYVRDGVLSGPVMMAISHWKAILAADAELTRLRNTVYELREEMVANGNTINRLREVVGMPPYELAWLFHEAYERLAPEYDYKTRSESAVDWDSLPRENKGLMTATAKEVLAELRRRASGEGRGT